MTRPLLAIGCALLLTACGTTVPGQERAAAGGAALGASPATSLGDSGLQAPAVATSPGAQQQLPGAVEMAD